jgi:hypothetical protein
MTVFCSFVPEQLFKTPKPQVNRMASTRWNALCESTVVQKLISMSKYPFGGATTAQSETDENVAVLFKYSFATPVDVMDFFC